MLKRLFAALILLAFAAGPANAAVIFIPMYFPAAGVPGAQTADYAGIHTVAVISALGSQITMRNNHFIAPKEHALDIQSWKLDDEIAARLKQYLSPRFEFKDVSFDRAALAKIPDGQWDGLFSGFTDFLKTLPHEQVDAYIVVRKGLAYQAPGIEGLGLENGSAFGDATPVVWTNYGIDIIDGKTGKQIGQAYSRVRLRDNTPPSFCGIFASPALKVGDDFNLSDNQLQLLHGTVSTMLNLSIVETLRALNIGVDLPPAGARTMVPIDPEKNPYKNYKNVAVVSALGKQFDVEHAGFSVLNHSTYPALDTGWDLDAHIEQQARTLLSQHFSVVEPNADRAAFEKTVLWNEDGKFAPVLAGLNPDPNIDLYVVFVPLRRPVWGVYKTTGLGVFNKTGLGTEGTYIFAHYAVAVIDAHTMKVLFARNAIMSPDHASPDPQQILDKEFWPSASPPVFSPEQMTKFHDTITDILDNSVNETLLQMFLLGVAPADGTPLPQISTFAPKDAG